MTMKPLSYKEIPKAFYAVSNRDPKDFAKIFSVSYDDTLNTDPGFWICMEPIYGFHGLLRYNSKTTSSWFFNDESFNENGWFYLWDNLYFFFFDNETDAKLFFATDLMEKE